MISFQNVTNVVMPATVIPIAQTTTVTSYSFNVKIAPVNMRDVAVSTVSTLLIFLLKNRCVSVVDCPNMMLTRFTEKAECDHA